MRRGLFVPLRRTPSRLNTPDSRIIIREPIPESFLPIIFQPDSIGTVQTGASNPHRRIKWT